MEISIELRELQPFLNERGQLKNWPAKKKRKVLALWYLAGQMEMGKVYSEAEINTLLDEWTVFHDPATLRRELFNHFLLNRTAVLAGGGDSFAGGISDKISVTFPKRGMRNEEVV